MSEPTRTYPRRGRPPKNSQPEKDPAALPPVKQPEVQKKRQLSAVVCPSVLPTPAYINSTAPCPDDRTGKQGRIRDGGIKRMRDGQPDEYGPDFCVILEDGRAFEVCNAPVAFIYDLDPIEVPLESSEIRTLAHQLMKIEDGHQWEQAIMEKIELNTRRARKHGQKQYVNNVMAELRAKQQRLAPALAITEPDDDLEAPPEISEEIVDGQEAEIPGINA